MTTTNKLTENQSRALRNAVRAQIIRSLESKQSHHQSRMDRGTADDEDVIVEELITDIIAAIVERVPVVEMSSETA